MDVNKITVQELISSWNYVIEAEFVSGLGEHKHAQQILLTVYGSFGQHMEVMGKKEVKE